jgi:hypothetical protein
MIIYKSHPEFISGSSKDSDPDESGRNDHKTRNLEGFLIIFEFFLTNITFTNVMCLEILVTL